MAVTPILDDSSDASVSSLAFIMALLVAQTRVETGVHSAAEVASGGAVGALDPLPLPGVRMTTPPVSDRELLARADAVAERGVRSVLALHVGCAVLAGDGRVIEGVNVENAAYPLGVCAERTALARAIAEATGRETSSRWRSPPPCGGCRQWLHELGVARSSSAAGAGS